ncbi:MAG: DNA mismatch repair protein MutS [Holosporaceae bacterium]|jgi:DNA mismatch repair protein MutS|nr:DNA mismatch repair protein MutS [Holosporaceae bacterium]
MEDNSLFYSTIKDATPVMSQYLTIKSQYPGCLLFFRMGDFYELFFDDAKIASSILNIALTHRGKHLNEDIPMCGIPVATLDNYLGKLVQYGQKVAICDQVEDVQETKKRGHNAIVKREITRILTAGTIIEENLLNANRNNFLMSVVPDIATKTGKINTVSFAAIDISTWDFFVNTCPPNEFSALFESYRPKEILVPSYIEKTDFVQSISAAYHVAITSLPDSKFNPIIEKERLEKHFRVSTLDSFEIKLSNELASCGAILEYLLITQRGNLNFLPPPRRVSFCNHLIMDPSTVKSLEIMTSCRGEYEYSLLGVVDRTKTFFGARHLATMVSMPLVNQELLENRLRCVEFFVNNEKLTRTARDALSGCPDFERAMSRIKFNKFSPRDIGDVRESLRVAISVQKILENAKVPGEGEYRIEKVKNFSDLLKMLDAALVEKLPAASGSYGVIADGFSKELDELKYLKNHSEDLISDLQYRYIKETGISSLKIRSNAIMGWYIEIPLSQKNNISTQFIHRQSLVNSVRYTSDELNSLQAKLADVFEEWSRLERKLYHEVVHEILKFQDDFSYAIKVLALLDIFTNFASIAIERGYVKPTISSEPVLEVERGKHPILDLCTKDFTSNSCDLNLDSKVCLLTGPNMAGKSTYLRQNALIIILAQIGSYVPAVKATIGIVDRLFSRIGASDDIARGRSTFMVEMIETATILNQATEKSFVILDEVGRGTSTYDGLAIAWAVIENLCKINKSRVLFATHYRELTALQNSRSDIKCKTLKVQEWNGEVIFYHKIIDGVADKSYGIHVASIAGVPKSVLKRAAELLKKFEAKNTESFTDVVCEFPDQMELIYSAESKLKQKLNAIDLNNISSKNALDLLYELKELT